jgi:EAL domain-containing protein (putative c-di-GMP-specific phosphodiesterase class I)
VVRYQPGQDESHLRELKLIADLAEQSGQLHDLTAHILERVSEDARAWTAQGVDAGVAINLSAKDLTWPRLTDHLARTFAHWHHALARITLEVTESALMEDPEEALATLNKLRALGVTLSVDDVGTGYSLLSQLRQMPVQKLKIDKSFVLNLDTEPQDQLIVKSTIDMAHGLGLKVMAEGIENLDAWHLLRAWGCNLGQGFGLSRPVPPTDLPAVRDTLAERRRALIQKPTENASWPLVPPGRSDDRQPHHRRHLQPDLGHRRCHHHRRQRRRRAGGICLSPGCPIAAWPSPPPGCSAWPWA